jgi:hypothetical protein
MWTGEGGDLAQPFLQQDPKHISAAIDHLEIVRNCNGNHSGFEIIPLNFPASSFLVSPGLGSFLSDQIKSNQISTDLCVAPTDRFGLHTSVESG